ncbi:hypothetical protein ABH927_004292 [Planotetraspora sp. GP83]
MATPPDRSPSRKIGRHLRYVPEDVMSWVREQE